MIAARVKEDRDLSVTMKEVEVRAVTSAIYAAAGHQSAARNAQKFQMFKKKMDRPADRPTIRELSKTFPAGSGAYAMFSPEEIAAEAERQKLAVA